MEFLLDKEHNLKYAQSNNFEEFSLLDENVRIFGITHGKDSSTHLVYLKSDGALNYVIFKDGKIIESLIGNFDTRSNTYNQIEILIIKGKINIFYSYSNIINSNIYTIHHVIINDESQEKYNIIRYVSKKREKSFSVSNDSSGNIHLLYNTVSESFSHIYYTYFKPYKNQWLNSPTKLSTSDSISDNPYIMVDSKDNIHSFYWDRKNGSFYLRVKRMSQSGKDMYKWYDIKLARVIEDSPRLKIQEKNDLIYVETDNLILVSEDYGITYKEEIPLEEDPIEKNTFLENNINPLEIDLLEDNNLPDSNSDNILNEDGLDNYLNELKESYQEIKDSNNENKIILEELILNEEDIKLKINTLLEELESINSSISRLEEALKDSKSGFRRLFS